MASPAPVPRSGYVQSPTSSSTYVRRLGGAELGPALAISGPRPTPREPIRIHIFHDVTSPVPMGSMIPTFRTAWLALRYLSEPDIATTFSADDCTKSYTVPSTSPADTEAWLKRTFFVATQNETVEDIVRAEQHRTELMPVLHIIPTSGTYFSPTSTGTTSFSATILLLISHWRTEALGCHLLLSSLYTLAADILARGPLSPPLTSRGLNEHVYGTEILLLSPPAEALAQPTPPSPAALAAATTRIASYFMHFRSKLPSIELPLKPDLPLDTTPGPVGVRRRLYSPSNTSSLLAAARNGSVSLTSLVHAAYIESVWPLKPENVAEQRWYASMMPVQIRTRLSTANDSVAATWRAKGCWNSAQMILLLSPPPVEGPGRCRLLERAKGLRECYRVSEREEWLRDEYGLWNEQMGEFHATVGAGIAREATPWFTSLGVLDKEGKGEREMGVLEREFGLHPETKQPSLRVEDVYGWADPMSLGCVLTMWTWQERLNLQISWNSAFHGSELIRTILDGMEERLEPILRSVGNSWEREEREFEY